MKNKLLISGISIMGLIMLHFASDVYAYPWFARRLVDNCNKCHSSFPKNNDYGWFVKSTGYELPDIDYEGLEESAVSRFFRYLPVAARFEVDAINTDPSDLKGDFAFREIQLISGGSILDNKISWWFHKHVVEDNTAVSLFDGNPHEMWAQYNVKFGKFNVNRIGFRYGMSELPLRFSPSKTSLSEIGYAIYNAVMGNSTFSLSAPQYGIGVNGLRLGGEGYNVVKSTFALTIVNGEGDFSSSKFTQVFGRIGTTVAKTMVGAFTYIGSQDLAMAAEDEHGDEHGDEVETMKNSFFRLGFDVDANITPEFNLYGLALYGRDSNPLALHNAQSGNYYGGFVGVDYNPSERLMFSYRFDAVRFGSQPEAEQEENHGEEAHQEGEEEGEDEHGGGHHGGDMIKSDTDAMVFGIQFVPIPNYYRLRLTTEYRIGFRGLSDRFLVGFQYAL